MEENDNLEVEQSGASEASPEPSSTGEGASNAPKQETKQPDTTPFHEHPRWIERDNELKQERAARQQLEQKYSQIESQLKELSQPKSPDKRAALIERLKGIDPEFGELMNELSVTPKELAEFRKQQAQEASNRTAAQARSTVDGLHTQYKVADNLKDIYERELVAAEAQGQIKTLADVAPYFKSMHDRYTKIFDDVKRAERESYVQSKKADSKTPTSQPKGSPAGNSKKGEFTGDKDADRASIVSRILNQAKASNSL